MQGHVLKFQEVCKLGFETLEFGDNHKVEALIVSVLKVRFHNELVTLFPSIMDFKSRPRRDQKIDEPM